MVYRKFHIPSNLNKRGEYSIMFKKLKMRLKLHYMIDEIKDEEAIEYLIEFIRIKYKVGW